MKNNQEKLTDAFGMLREDTVDACVTDKPSIRPARSRTARRVAVLLAACLTFAMMGALVLILPALRSEGPTPPATDSPTEFPIHPSPELSYHDAPLVNLQILSLSEEEVEDPDALPEAPESSDVAMTYGGSLFDSNAYILFNLEDGETITARAHNSRITVATLREGGIRFKSWYAKFLHDTAHGYVNHGARRYEVTIDSAEAFLHWGGTTRYWNENYAGGTPDEDFIDLVFRDGEGRITGAGCIYLANRKVVDNPNSRYYDDTSITRGKVLGSVRFDNPDEVTEEQVDAYLANLRESAAEIGETMFDNPNMFEQFKLAFGDLVKTRYADFDNFGTASSYANKDRYMAISFYNDKEPNFHEGRYFLLEDGTWCERACDGSYCEYCALFKTDTDSPFTPPCEHWNFTHDRFVLTDGRILDEHWDYAPSDGGGTTTSSYLVPVTENTYTAPEVSQVIHYLMHVESPLENTVIEAYRQIEQQLSGQAQVLDVLQPFRWMGMRDRVWAPFASIIVKDAEGNTRAFLVLKDGQYFEYSHSVYTCNECAFSSHGGDWSDEMHTHERTAVFHLTDGSTYSILINWETHEFGEPVYTPAA